MNYVQLPTAHAFQNIWDNVVDPQVNCNEDHMYGTLLQNRSIDRRRQHDFDNYWAKGKNVNPCPRCTAARPAVGPPQLEHTDLFSLTGVS